MKVSLEEMRLAIQWTHDCRATRCIDASKVGPLAGRYGVTVEVHLFEIDGHPTMTQCYAWAVEVGERKIVIPTVLRSKKVSTAEQAVKLRSHGAHKTDVD